MNKPMILTAEGIAKLEKEIDDVENSLIPLAKKDLKTAKLWGSIENIRVEKSDLKGLKKRLSVLKIMLEEAVRV